MKNLEKIRSDLKKAIKTENTLERDTLRMLLSEIHNAEIAKKGELSDDEVTKEIFAQVKKRKEAILEYQKAGRFDLASKEQRELEILQKYLPQLLSPVEIEKKAKEVISQTKAKKISDFGKVMGVIMKKFAGKADGAAVSKIVQRLLKGDS